MLNKDLTLTQKLWEKQIQPEVKVLKPYVKVLKKISAMDQIFNLRRKYQKIT
jgi:hypothetical protein